MEIKCPYCHRGESVAVAASKDSKFCLQRNSAGLLHLDPGHAYYYQVQTQLFVRDVEYCDFCVCTFNGDESGIHIVRIFKDEQLWNDCVIKAKAFFKTCILPELLGKWYTRPCSITIRTDQMGLSALTDQPGPSGIADSSGATDISSCQHEEKYCYCSGPDEGQMIACENSDCAIEWFHTSCLMITTIPRGKWYCPDCRKLPQFKQKRSKSKLKDITNVILKV